MATTIESVDEATVSLVVPLRCPGLRVSPEAFWEICVANPDLRLARRANGELIVMAPTGSETGARNAALGGQLWMWNRLSGLGVVFDSSTGFTLPNGFVHAPDAAWATRERWDALSAEQRRRFAPICPDFVVELMSPSDRRDKTRERLEEFLAQGARLGWLIDPTAGEVEIHHPGQPPEVLKRPTTLSGEDVLPGLELDLKGILFD